MIFLDENSADGRLLVLISVRTADVFGLASVIAVMKNMLSQEVYWREFLHRADVFALKMLLDEQHLMA